MAHETGHSLGVSHDISYGCTEGLNIMSTSSARSNGAFEWSSCSSEHMKIFISSRDCMDDFPTTALAPILELPGQSVDDQCKMVLDNPLAYSCASFVSWKLFHSLPALQNQTLFKFYCMY
ncbi:A disintegrin and metalloproteinase with thrombospondin motifs 5-like [Strongylocentrotus purpuratus]|uniref:Peptidase M12B domain-containing protein n=1 Tax=Strongylocentrotus purpuratus TaxID=7668 RepID=A0A7M7NDM5_STRPU|nr:A disintegrin and metalloproteinase with thrombospondin motifs 5-like [Strongylocentrotus purpuratus]